MVIFKKFDIFYLFYDFFYLNRVRFIKKWRLLFKTLSLFRAVANVHLFISGTLSLHVYRMMLTLITAFFADKKTT